MSQMTFIMGNGSHRDVDAPNGLSIMEIAHKNKIYEIEGACEGSLSCATCHVIVSPEWFEKLSEVSEAEEDMLDLAFNLSKTSRLSCQIKMCDALDGIVVALPEAPKQW